MTTATSDAMAIGTRLVEFCREGKNMESIETLYDKNIKSAEACSAPDMEQTMVGVEKIKGKNQWWAENHEVHGCKIDGPYPNGDRFIVSMKYDITPKVGPMAGNRFTMEEMGLFTVKNGKVVEEEFFYNMG